MATLASSHYRHNQEQPNFKVGSEFSFRCFSVVGKYYSGVPYVAWHQSWRNPAHRCREMSWIVDPEQQFISPSCRSQTTHHIPPVHSRCR